MSAMEFQGCSDWAISEVEFLANLKGSISCAWYHDDMVAEAAAVLPWLKQQQQQPAVYCL